MGLLNYSLFSLYVNLAPLIVHLTTSIIFELQFCLVKEEQDVPIFTN